MGLGDEVDLAIFVRDAGTVVAGISGWTWGDCCELQSLWVAPGRRGRGLATKLLAAAEAEAAARGGSQTVHFTYDFQAPALYSAPATSSWVASTTSPRARTSGGTASAPRSRKRASIGLRCSASAWSFEALITASSATFVRTATAHGAETG